MKMKNSMLAAALAAVFLLGGCGAGSTDESTGDSAPVTEAKSDITAEQLFEGIDEEKLDGRLFTGDEKFDKNLAKLYNTDAENIVSGGMLYNTEGIYADEISAIKFRDGTDGEALMQARLDSRTATFRDYRPEELDKLSKAKIISAGGYDVLIISDNAEDLAEFIIHNAI